MMFVIYKHKIYNVAMSKYSDYKHYFIQNLWESQYFHITFYIRHFSSNGSLPIAAKPKSK
jgi:hypothetical protein